ncbi:hypothetical protein MCELANE86_01043 [Candidatus Nanopelagicaceae bacterium]
MRQMREVGDLFVPITKAVPKIFWVIAAISGLRFRIIGDIYLGEIISLLILLDNTLAVKRRVSSTSKFDILAYIWISFQIVSNLINHTSITKSIVVVGTACITIIIIKAFLILHRRGYSGVQILMFVFLGQAIAGILQPKDYGLVNGWKFQYGYFLGAFIVLLLIRRGNIKLAQLSLIGLTVISLSNSARSLASFFLISFMFSISSTIVSGRSKQFSRAVFRLLIMICVLVSIYASYLLAAKAGYLGVKEIARANHLTTTIYGPLVGRSEVFYSLQAIQKKPFLGYGGEPEVGTDFLLQISTNLNEQGIRNVGGGDHVPDSLPMHSILLSTAIFAGLPAAIFWLFGLIQSTRFIQYFQYMARRERIPIVLISISQLWNILFSPYGALLRLSISSSLVFLYIQYSERDLNLMHQEGYSFK